MVRTRTRRSIVVRTTHAAKAFTLVAAAQPHRHRAQHQLLRQIGEVQTVAHQDVTLTEGIAFAIAVRVEPFVDVDMDLPLDVLQTRIAHAPSVRVDGPFNMKEAVDVAQLHMYRRRVGKLGSFEFFDGDQVVDQHNLPAAAQEPTDIDLM